ncbi:MAG: UBP-type zinc finger domain-containing protein [Actinomycetota bacterium]|nr:UBP-type zinc finger domain-containing protein [Actinomycetota bacterium]
MTERCVHFDEAQVLDTDVRVCAECVALGSRWVHLRLCLTCGHVGCCDSSPNRHATAHFRATHDPAIRSLEPGEEWGYCYVDDAFVEKL